MSRVILYDRPIKTLLCLGHIFAFSIYYGSTLTGMEASLARSVAILTGVLLVAREVYQGGWVWFTRTDGICTLLKIVLILTDDLVGPYKPLMLSGVVLLGVFAAHLPDSVRKKYWFASTTTR